MGITFLGKEQKKKITPSFDTVEGKSVMDANLESFQKKADKSAPQEQLNALQEKVDSNTGLPLQLKAGVEQLSGVSLDDVQVNYNSDKPSQLKAKAYAEGNQIHLSSGEEKQLPHEAWHVVQQKQKRVQPTVSMNGTQINDDPTLEKEATQMGEKANFLGSPTFFNDQKEKENTP